jgi:hypothetical protein
MYIAKDDYIEISEGLTLARFESPQLPELLRLLQTRGSREFEADWFANGVLIETNAEVQVTVTRDTVSVARLYHYGEWDFIEIESPRTSPGA